MAVLVLLLFLRPVRARVFFLQRALGASCLPAATLAVCVCVSGAACSDVVVNIPAEATSFGIATAYRQALVAIGCVVWTYLCIPVYARSHSASVAGYMGRRFSRRLQVYTALVLLFVVVTRVVPIVSYGERRCSRVVCCESSRRRLRRCVLSQACSSSTRSPVGS